MFPKRFKVILIIFILFFTGIVARLFQLQIIEGDKYKGFSEKRRIATYPLEATRGSIFDRNGCILAMDQHTFDISVQYKYLLYCYIASSNKTIARIAEMKAHKDTGKSCAECHKNQDIWLKGLAQLLEIPQSKLLDYARQGIERVERLKQAVEQRIGRTTRIKEETDYYPIVTDVAWEKVIQLEINNNKFPGVRVTPRPKRIYPGQTLASHILGYMTRLTEDEWKLLGDNRNNLILNSSGNAAESTSLLYDGYAENDYIGRTGIEAQYEEDLHGMRGKRFEEITCKNTQTEKVILEKPPVAGNNVYLTIDSQIQSYAEKSLGANLGAIIVMDPSSGEIFAIASNPRFNPNTVNEDFNKLIRHPSKPFLNRAIQGALPPGSIFKVITAIAALSTNSIDTTTSFGCQGYTSYKNIQFKCLSAFGHGLVTIEDAIPYSCNVFFFETAKALGGNRLYAWAKKLGVGEKTGIDLPYENSGNLPNMTSTPSVMNVAIGQGSLLTTPLQLLRLYAVVANGGTLVQPHLLLKLTNNQGETIQAFKPENNQKISINADILHLIRMSLHDVITRGTGRDKGLEIYRVAGKTGTAETGHEKYNHAWFVGYAPYNNPRYCFVILVEHTPGHGADVACPIARELMSYLFPEVNEAS